MATVPAVAYLGDTNDYAAEINKWGAPHFHRIATFTEGPIGEKCQRNISKLSDGFDENAGGSTYSDEILFNGQQVCKMYCPKGSDGEQAFGGSFVTDVSARRHQEVWSQCRLFLPSDKTNIEEVARGGGGWKLMRQRVVNTDHSVGHADIYFNSNYLNPGKPLYFNCEAQTSTSNGHSPHNGVSNIGDRSVWDIPYDEWFNIQYYTFHDVGHNGDPRARLMAWHGDTLIADLSSTQTTERHTMISDTDYVTHSHLCTYINTANNRPGSPNYDPNGPEHGCSEPQTWYCSGYEVTNRRPTYTDEFGNFKLPPMEV